MNIFDLAKQKLKENEEKSEKLDDTTADESDTASAIKRRRESVAIICGSSECGKTSFLLKYLERSDSVKATIALDYYYGRRTRGKIRDLCNIYELGGGAKLSNLLRVPMTEKNLEVFSLVIFLDLTKPQELWITFETLIDAARKQADSLMKEINQKDPALFDQITTARKTKLRDFGDDLKVCSPLPFPLLIVGAKYDEFQNAESEQRRKICQFLRFVAHYHCAGLIFFSSKMEPLVRQVKIMFSHYVLDTSVAKMPVVDHNKPLYIPVGTDSLSEIGAPPVALNSVARASQPMQLWRETFVSSFPQVGESSDTTDDPTTDPLFREPLIDSLVEQKRKDLEMLKKQQKDQLLAEQRAMQKIANL